ncbi:MAG: ATP-dependent sacrificial sulfur transferase LarE [Deltaproteobacteria bacterium]|nr:ATP-dependent sacrificial sulfur transferase LarE [Deltaproteobacteria bacterium]
MEKPLKEKLDTLQNLIQNRGSLVVAYSGGVDSTLLLRVAHEILGNNVVAVIARSPLHPAREYEEALRVAEEIGTECITIHAEEMAIPQFTQNPPNRCYYCKIALFTKILSLAREKGIDHVVDGTNLDDSEDYRPGIKALLELGIRGPLKEAQMTKADIRLISRELKLLTWDKPTQSCLASRFPYGEEIIYSKLQKVEEAESYLHKRGFRQIRMRIHRDLVRIEVSPAEIIRFMEDGFRGEILNHLKEIGFTYITLDLEGYCPGSMNRTLIFQDGGTVIPK